MLAASGTTSSTQRSTSSACRAVKRCASKPHSRRPSLTLFPSGWVRTQARSAPRASSRRFSPPLRWTSSCTSCATTLRCVPALFTRGRARARLSHAARFSLARARPFAGPQLRALGLHLLDDQAPAQPPAVCPAGPRRRHDDGPVHGQLRAAPHQDLPPPRRPRHGRCVPRSGKGTRRGKGRGAMMRNGTRAAIGPRDQGGRKGEGLGRGTGVWARKERGGKGPAVRLGHPALTLALGPYP